MAESSLKEVTEAMDTLIQHARNQGIAPHSRRKMRLFSTKEVCNLIGKSTTTLYKAEEQGIISKPDLNPDTGRRLGYTEQY